jgi:hypothetical protein
MKKYANLCLTEFFPEWEMLQKKKNVHDIETQFYIE